MFIRKVKIHNFKCYKDFEITLEEGLNIVVGDNEAGKSTILEAINLALTGIIRGKSIWNEISQYIFNKEAVDEYIVSLGTAPIALPYITNGIVFDAAKVEVNFISSINQYVDFLGQIRKKEEKLFFRGHSKVSYDLKPSLFRKEEWLSNEKKMYLELMAKCPYEFERLESHIEKLAEMQHYGLPTRLLDVTQNPLVALYFACESQHSYYGEIIIFSQSLDSIKYFQSDTVAMLASLPLFTKDEQMQFYHSSFVKSSNMNDFNDKVERLVHEVRMERPGFKSEIRAEDIRDVVVCIPARKNRRIDNQEGAFIVCGLLEETYGGKKYNTLSNLRLKLDNKKITICIIDKKAELLNELESLGINKAKIYPEIDDVADYIKTHVNIPT